MGTVDFETSAEVIKTSIPSSNLGGASIFAQEISESCSFGRRWCTAIPAVRVQRWSVTNLERGTDSTESQALHQRPIFGRLKIGTAG